VAKKDMETKELVQLL